MGKLASHDYLRPKPRRRNKENEKHGRRIAPKVAFVSKKCIRQSPFVQNNAPFNHLRNAAKLSCFFKKS